MNKEEFINNLKELNIEITDKKLNQLDLYYQILKEENNKYNLTAITEEKQVYLKHFFDSLTITKIIKLNSQSLCDIGTGAGFPGIVLKIIYPDLSVTLLESNKKKCNFLNIIKEKLNLTKLTIINKEQKTIPKNIEKYTIS